MRSALSLILMLSTMLLLDCATEDYVPTSEEKCRVGRFVYKQQSGADVSYNITYIEGSLTRPDVITEEILNGGTWVANAAFKHIYKNQDSLYIKNFNQFKEGATYLAAQLETKIQSVVTTFPGNNGTYRYTFDYAQTDQITITLEEINGNTATFDSRGIYHIDSRGDVVRLQITRDAGRHANDPDPFTTRDITYTYDLVLNPVQYLVLPHFLVAELPGPTYFSMHNRVTETSDGTTRNYNIVYGTDPMPKNITTPAGVVQKFEYPNCTN